MRFEEHDKERLLTILLKCNKFLAYGINTVLIASVAGVVGFFVYQLYLFATS